jgi:hypothetical protein
MALKMSYDKEKKQTFMRENAIRGKALYCMCCKRTRRQLYKYWQEPDIGGKDTAPRLTLPFCSVECYRKYQEYDTGDVA